MSIRLLMTFMAYTSSSNLLRTCSTRPKAPCPITHSSVKSSGPTFHPPPLPLLQLVSTPLVVEPAALMSSAAGTGAGAGAGATASAAAAVAGAGASGRGAAAVVASEGLLPLGLPPLLVALLVVVLVVVLAGAAASGLVAAAASGSPTACSVMLLVAASHK